MAKLPRPQRRRPRVPISRIKAGCTYDTNEIAKLLGLHRNAVRHWLKQGLATIDDRRPLLVHGAVLKAFLQARQGARRRKCRPDEFYCFECRSREAPGLASPMSGCTPRRSPSSRRCVWCAKHRCIGLSGGQTSPNWLTGSISNRRLPRDRRQEAVRGPVRLVPRRLRHEARQGSPAGRDADDGEAGARPDPRRQDGRHGLPPHPDRGAAPGFHHIHQGPESAGVTRFHEGRCCMYGWSPLRRGFCCPLQASHPARGELCC